MKEREIDGKFGQFNRVLMSYIDFQQTHDIADQILKGNLHRRYPGKNRIKLEALNSAMVVAYSRPFSGNRSIPDLPNRFIRHLSKDEKEIHTAVLDDRNSVIAHSDGESWSMRSYYEEIGDNRILIPLHNGVHRPFLREPTEKIFALACKQIELCFEVRESLEKELREFIPTNKKA